MITACLDELILSGYPYVEECSRVASELPPIVRSMIPNARVR